MKFVNFLCFLIILNLSIADFIGSNKTLQNNFDDFEVQNFLEKGSSTISKMNANSFSKLKLLYRKNNKSFKAKIYILKEKDPLEQKPHVFKANLKLTESIEIYQNKKLEKKISFLE